MAQKVVFIFSVDNIYSSLNARYKRYLLLKFSVNVGPEQLYLSLTSSLLPIYINQ